MFLERGTSVSTKDELLGFSCKTKSEKSKNNNTSHSQGPQVGKHKDTAIPALESDAVAMFGKRGQALLGGYDFSALKSIISHTAFESLQEFQDSKPSVSQESIKIYSYRTKLTGQMDAYQCVWYKFKSPEVIDSKLPLPKIAEPVDPKEILELAFLEARKLKPRIASIVDVKGYTFTFASEDKRTGFNWIGSDITIELKDKHLYIKTPTLITNRYVPVFGGMSYCKVFTPQDAAAILTDLARGEFGKKGM